MALNTRPTLLMLIISTFLLAIVTSSLPVSRVQAATDPNMHAFLNFSGGAGGIDDTGFAQVVPQTVAVREHSSLTPEGYLLIQTGAGDMVRDSAASQENALAFTRNPVGSFSIATRLIGPLPFETFYQSAGVVVAIDRDNYIKFVVGQRNPTGLESQPVFELSREVDDGDPQTEPVFESRFQTEVNGAPLDFSTINTLDLFLNFDAGNQVVSAFYRLNSNAADDIEPFTADVGGASSFSIPPALLSNTQYIGVLATHFGGDQVNPSVQVRFDWFRLAGLVAQNPATQCPPPGDPRPDLTDSDADNRSDLSELDNGTDPCAANAGPLLSVELAAASQADAGALLSYNVTLSSSNAASPTSLSFPIPQNTSYVAGSLAITGSATAPVYNPGSNQVTWNGSVPTSGNVRISFNVQVISQLRSFTLITANATAIANNNTITRTRQTEVQSQPELASSTLTALQNTVGPGGLIDFQLVLRNTGNANAESLDVTLELPSGTTLLPASLDETPTPVYNPTTHTISWPGVVVNVGSAPTLTFRLQVRGPAFTNNDLLTINADLGGLGEISGSATYRGAAILLPRITRN